MDTTLLKTINSEIYNFQNKDIQVVPGFSFNQYDTLNQIFFYYNSKFTTGEVDEEGDKKYFYNIVKNPCKVFSKAIDFDTKNIRLLTVGGGDPLKTWFMERDLKYWMRDKKFGLVLNRLFRELPIYGSVVLKVVDGYPYFVDLRNFVVEQTAETLNQSNYIIEVHNYTPGEFRRVAKDMGWKQSIVDEVIEKFYQMKGITHIRVYERYGDVAEDDEKGNRTYTYKRVFFADVGVDEYDQYGNMKVEHPGVLIEAKEWDGHPYWEFHAEKLPGRWLGIGVVETLFEPQIRLNELCNLQSKASYWAALRLFFSRDPKMAGNLATEKRNGDVITGDDPITQIDMSDRNLAFFNEEHTKWLSNRDEQTFSYDVVQGERLPAGTPLGSAQIAQTQTLSYFEQIQETVAMDVKEMLYQVTIPQFEKDMNSEHILRLVGQDLDQYTALIKNELVNKEVVKLALESLNGKPFPTAQDRDTISIAVEESIKQGKEKLLQVPKGFYKDVKYDVDIDITGESVDTRVRAATKFAILQAITADPTMTMDPVKRKLLASYAEDGGLNPNDFLEVEKKDMESMSPMMGRAGGGVSAPDFSNAVAGQTSQTL